MSEPEPYGFERAAGGGSLPLDGSEAGESGAAGAAGADSVADDAASSLDSAARVGTGRGATRTARGIERLRSTDKLSTSTTFGALLGAVGDCSTAGFWAPTFTMAVAVVVAVAAAACALGRCFKLRTSDAPAAEAVTQTTSAMHADNQRGRSLNVSAA